MPESPSLRITFANTDVGREAITISPDFERVSNAGVVAGSPDAGREMVSIPLDSKLVPDSGVTADATDAGWETMSIPSDCAHIPGAGIAADALGPRRERTPTPSDYERVPGTGSNAGGPLFKSFNEWGGGLHDSIPGNITRKLFPGIGLHDPLNGRQAQPQFISLHLGSGQMCSRSRCFRAVPSKNKETFVTSPPPPPFVERLHCAVLR